MMDYTYDPALDRLDVAVLAVWHLAEQGRWEWLAELGGDKEALLTGYQQVSQEYERPRHADKAQRAVFRFLALCPAVLVPATELVRRYEEQCGVERVAYFQRLRMLASSQM